MDILLAVCCTKGQNFQHCSSMTKSRWKNLPQSGIKPLNLLKFLKLTMDIRPSVETLKNKNSSVSTCTRGIIYKEGNVNLIVVGSKVVG